MESKSPPLPRDDLASELLVEIARCPAVFLARQDASHPCADIVRYQRDKFGDDHVWQPPNPWIGRIDEAPILFIGSNPNIGGREWYPKEDASQEELSAFFHHAFEGPEPQVKRGILGRLADGTYSEPVRTWAGVKKRAAELLERSPLPGRDYALGEIVHCRSQREFGVDRARDRCADLYLERLIGVSAARVVVAFGAHNRHWLRRRWDLPAKPVAEKEIGGRRRLIAFLPHPVAFGKRTFGDVMPEELERLRAWLRQIDSYGRRRIFVPSLLTHGSHKLIRYCPLV